MTLPAKASRIRHYFLPILVMTLIITALMRKLGYISEANLKYSLLIPAILETLLMIVLIINISKIKRQYKKFKSAGWNNLDALQKALEIILSPRLARWLTIEPRLYYALYLSYKRKPYQNSIRFTTRMNSYQLLIKVMIFLCMLEILAVTLLLPNKWMTWKLIHLIVGLWAILWLWADCRAVGLYNHLITLEGIRFRLGLHYDGKVPWEDIGLVREVRVIPPEGAMAPKIAQNDPSLFYLGIGEICNMEITLKKPYCFQGMFNDFQGVTRLLLSLENPDDFMARIRSIQPGLCS